MGLIIAISFKLAVLFIYCGLLMYLMTKENANTNRLNLSNSQDLKQKILTFHCAGRGNETILDNTR